MRLLTLVFFAVAITCCLAKEAHPFRVAVIGSGISGAASSYFLRSLLDSKRSPSDAHSRPLKIDVYEKSDTVGGRVQNIVVDGLATEMGGSIFLDRNEYVMHFVKTLGLEAVKASEQPFRIGVWDQDHSEFSFIQSHWKLLSLVKMMSRYGPFNVLKLRSETLGLLEKWMKIYEIQEKGMAFNEVDEFFKYLGLFQYTQETFNQTCPEPLRSSDLIRELGYGVTLINYNQQIEHMSSLAAYISLSTLASGAPLFKVKNGNNQMVRGLFDKTHAKVHTKSTVKKISLVSKSPVKYSVTLKDSAEPVLYDAVIIATPLELTEIEFDASVGVSPSQFPQRAFQVTHNTIVKGTPNPAFWNVSSAFDMPDIVMFARAHPVRTKLSSFATWLIYPDGQRLVKIFSPEEVPDSVLDQLFLNRSEVHRLPWKAYTKFAPPEKFPPTVLSPRLYYVSAIENAGSALEMMSVWARNVAMLLTQSILDEESSHATSPSGGAAREEL